MQLTHMSPAQAAVLSLLPTLTEPYNPPSNDDSDASSPSSPTPVRDLLVKARTGTGKTLAFLVPAIEARLKSLAAHSALAASEAGQSNDVSIKRRAERIFASHNVGALVLSPTRELATQIANEAMKLTKHHDGFGVQLLVGGVSKGGQMKSWTSNRLDIVVATPGRMRDLLETEPAVERAISKAQMVRFLQKKRSLSSAYVCVCFVAYPGRSGHTAGYGFQGRDQRHH